MIYQIEAIETYLTCPRQYKYQYIERVYRNSRSLADALDVIGASTGSQFDADVVVAMFHWVEDVACQLDKVGLLTVQDLLDSQEACVVAA